MIYLLCLQQITHEFNTAYAVKVINLMKKSYTTSLSYSKLQIWQLDRGTVLHKTVF